MGTCDDHCLSIACHHRHRQLRDGGVSSTNGPHHWGLTPPLCDEPPCQLWLPSPMPFSLAAALVSGTRPGSEHLNIWATFCGGPIDAALIHAIVPVAAETGSGSRPKVQLALPPDAAFQVLRDAAGEANDLTAHDPARVDASASFAQLVGAQRGPGSTWLVTRRALCVHGAMVVGHLLYGAVAADGTAIGCELEVSPAAPEEDASHVGLVLHDSGAAQLTPAPMATTPPALGVWVRKRAEEQPGVEFMAGGDALLTPVNPEALQLGIPLTPGKRVAPVAWDAQSCPDLGAWLEALPAQDQGAWLLAIERSVGAANTASCEVCFALQAAHVALAALPGDGTPLFEAPCLAQAGLDSLAHARAGMLRCALAHHLVSSPETLPEGHIGGWDCGSAAPLSWAAVGTALRVRLPRGDRLGLMHSLERQACEGGSDGAGLLALVAALSWLPTAAAPGGPPPSSFLECLGASCRAIVRLPIGCRVMLRSQLVTAWRVALHMRSDAQLLAFLQRRAVDLQQRRAKVASGSPPRPDAGAPRGKATFRGTVHSAWSEGGSNGTCVGGEALVFDFRVVTALDVGDDAQSSLYGVRFDASCMAPGQAFDGVMEGDTVEAEAVCIDAKMVRATGVRVVRRGPGGGRPQDLRRRVQAGRDELVACGAAASAASAPTLPGWVQAAEVNHDGAPLWAGPCSACGVLCTVPFRPRQPMGCAISSPPLCRQCRTAQLAVQAQQAAQAQGGMASMGAYPVFSPMRHGTPPPGMTSPRHSFCAGASSVRGASPPLPPMAGHMSALGPFGLGAEGSQHGGASAAHLPRRIGVVKFYKADSGFGFIQPLTADGSPSLEPDIFVHCTQAPAPVHPDSPPLVHGQVVEYNEVFSFGRRQAVALSLPIGTAAQDPWTPPTRRPDIRRASFDDAALLERQSGLQLPPVLFPDSLEEDASGEPRTPLYTFTDQARHVMTNDNSGGTASTMTPDDDSMRVRPTRSVPTSFNFFSSSSNGGLW